MPRKQCTWSLPIQEQFDLVVKQATILLNQKPNKMQNCVKLNKDIQEHNNHGIVSIMSS
jgi:hypothetical protein